MRNKLLVFAILSLALVLSACGPTTIRQEAAPPVRSLTVNGLGQVELAPDIAYIYIGVHTEGASASEAVADNNTQTEALITALTDAGVDAKDIRTTNFNIWPSTPYGPDGQQLSTIY